MEVVRSFNPKVLKQCPVYGAGADLLGGALLMRGVTGETDLGVLINCTAGSNADAIGVLNELHDYSEVGDALVAGATNWFKPFDDTPPSHEVELIDNAILCKIEYDTGDTMAIASMNSTTSVRVTSIEDGLDTGFLYVVSGTGIGQNCFIKSDDGTDLVLATAPATGLVAADTLVKILPLYHYLVKWDVATATDYTKIGTDAAAGTGRAIQLERHIVRNGLDELMDPVAHGNLASLNGLAQLKFYGIFHIQNSMFHPID